VHFHEFNPLDKSATSTKLEYQSDAEAANVTEFSIINWEKGRLAAVERLYLAPDREIPGL
jgi:hypothetical protein